MAKAKVGKKKKRGAAKKQTPRSAFRGAKTAAKKPAPKTAAKSKPKSAKAATKAKASKRKAAIAHSAETSSDAASTAIHVRLGEVTAPSGKLAVFDVGLIGYLPRPALEPALITTQVPTDRALPVIGRRVGKGRFADCWDHVVVRISDGEVTHSKKLGEAGVDFARLICMDHGALDHWQHEDSLDGLADFVFWGRDAPTLAQVMGAPSTKEGFGWRNLPIAEAEAKADEAERRKASNRWLLATDYRPHSHHFHALAAARKSKLGAGTIDVGGARVCLFFTSWGDGVFPVYLDLDHNDQPVQVRVQLNTAESIEALHAVN